MSGLVVIQGKRLPAQCMLGIVVLQRPETGVQRPPEARGPETVRGRVQTSALPPFCSLPSWLFCSSLGWSDWLTAAETGTPLVGTVMHRFNSLFSRLAVSVSLKFFPSFLVCGHAMYSATIMWEMVVSSRIKGDSAGFFAFIIKIIAAMDRVLGTQESVLGDFSRHWDFCETTGVRIG